MIKHIIKRATSLIVVTSLIICSTCTNVSASDLELSRIMIQDAIEDIEYKERESSYKEER